MIIIINTSILIECTYAVMCTIAYGIVYLDAVQVHSHFTYNVLLYAAVWWLLSKHEKVFNLKKKTNYKEKSYSDGLETPTIETEFLHATNIAILYVNNHGRK